HHVGHIGLLGVDRKGEEYYQITIGGSADEATSLGEIVGPAVSYDNVVDAVEKIVGTYIDVRQNGESFLETYRRVGKDPFKENLYASH
ncbi:MAG: nitrite/sulfite reductase, partial [Alphaproteobacteria bacterium]